MTWKILIGLAHLSFDLALIWMLFGRHGKRGSANVRSDGRIEFAPDWIGLWAYPLTIAYSVWLAARALLHSHAKLSDFLTPAIFGAIALSLLISFPGTIVVADGGLESVYWLRRNKRIQWEDIAEIETDKNSTSFTMVMITITGADGTRIVHSWLLADRPRFLSEIRKHCGEALPPDFPSV
jgi:hypothetical protein